MLIGLFFPRNVINNTDKILGFMLQSDVNIKETSLLVLEKIGKKAYFFKKLKSETRFLVTLN
jgi:hypothetical protein